MKSKPKKIIPLVLLLVSLAVHQGIAQSNKPQKWEFGTDLLFLFDKNQLPDYSFFATRKIGDKGYALRSRLGFDMNFVKPVAVADTPFFADSQFYNYLILAGLEKELSKITLSKGTKLYWAVDLAFSQYLQDYQTKTYQEHSGMMFLTRKIRDNTYSFAGAIGVKQSITPSISIRLESALSLNQLKQHTESAEISLDADSPTDKKELLEELKSNPDYTIEYSGHTNQVRFTPFNQLLLTIKF